MPFILWNDALELGIKTIDDQHKGLAELVNTLHDEAVATGISCPPPDLVARLKAYAREHFHIEEGYMQAFGYPEFEAHVREHEAFGLAVADFEARCAAGQAHPAEMLEFLKSWLTVHILDVDRKMGHFLEDHLR